MESIGSTYTASTSNFLGVNQRERTYRDQEPERQTSFAKPPESQVDRQEDIRYSETSDEFQPYGPNGVSRQQRDIESTAGMKITTGAEIPDNTKPSGEPPVSAQRMGSTPGASGSAIDSQQDPRIQADIARLKVTEEKVKAHEAAHKAVGGTMTGPVSFSYTRGPDGKSYITGGEVPIKISSGKTPEETVDRMDQVIRAALAPADPSPQDRAVAAQASSIQQQARMEMTSERTQAVGEKGAISGGENRPLDQKIETSTAVDMERSHRGSDTASTINAFGRRTEEVQSAAIWSSDSVDSTIVRVSRLAYGNPATAGNGEDTKSREIDNVRRPQQEQASPSRTPAASFFPPSQNTGFAPVEPISIYA